MPFIAEDLGMITPEVVALRDSCGLPGMKVMQFGFDGNPENPHLPHAWTYQTVAYTGTHDNNTTRGWFEALPDGQKQLVRNFLGWSAGQSWDRRRADAFGVVLGRRADDRTVAGRVEPGAEARMNVPGRAQGTGDGAGQTARRRTAFRWLLNLPAHRGAQSGSW